MPPDLNDEEAHCRAQTGEQEAGDVKDEQMGEITCLGTYDGWTLS